MSLLGIDVGTTGTKAVVFSTEGKQLASAYREYPLIYPRPGWLEFSPFQVLDSAKRNIREVAEAVSGKDPIRALGIASLGEAVTPVSAQGDPVYNTIIAFDNRTTEQARWWEEKVGREHLFRITGMPLHGIYTINKAMWLREHEPERFARTKQFLCWEELLILKMGFEPTTDYSLAARTMAFDIHRKDWSDEVLGEAGFTRAHFARVAPPGTMVGRLGPTTAAEWGLPSGTVVATGGFDQPCSALGAGVVRPGAAADGTGTVECITAACSEPVLSPQMLEGNYCCLPHVVEGLYVTLAFNFTGGCLLRWYRDNFGEEELKEAAETGRDVYEVLISRAAKGCVDVYVLPHFTMTGTPWFDPEARGAILGLRLSTTAGEIIKAILDGITFEMRLNLERLEDAGVPVKEMRATGGGARSSTWLQLKADIFGRPVLLPDVTEATCLAAAILAGVAAGEYTSAQQAADRVVKMRARYDPDLVLANAYTERYAVYRDIYPTLRDLLHQI